MKVLVIDVGGSHVKAIATGRRNRVRFESGPKLTAAAMVRGMKELITDWQYDAVTIGYPGPVVDGRPSREPRNLGGGWVKFDYDAAFGKPVRVINDAAMQALGSYAGGRMLFLGLGTGLGTCLIDEGHIVGLEAAHLPYKKGKSFEEYVGERGLDRLGRKRWEEAVHDVVERFSAAFVCDEVVLGGGNARLLKQLPPGARLGDNANAFAGGMRVWHPTAMRAKAHGHAL